MGRTIKFRVWDKVLNGWRIVEMREDNTYLQFTGLHDKNGKEIYEGDIVSDYPFFYCINAVIEFRGGAWVMVFPNDSSSELFDNERSIEVIGNIYENPELLQETSHG